MKGILLIIAALVIATPVLAAPPEARPTLIACKTDLKEWSQEKTEGLTIAELNKRMNVMFACADLSKKHEKQVRAYLDEFYRAHAELANRAFNFITRHGLAEQFGAEENGNGEHSTSDTAAKGF
jgi:hypothetical protein